MKYDEEILDKHIEDAGTLFDYIKDIVWEKQEGQEQHFDNLPKVEQIALIDIFNQTASLRTALINYKHWFK